MLQEGNQTSSDRGNLLRSNVHQIHLCGRNNWVVIVATALNHLTDKRTILAQGSITLTDNKFLLFLCTIVSDTFGRKVNDTILYLSIGSLNKAKVVDLCVYTKTADKTDVWTFRRLDRTQTAIVGEMYVTNLETGTLTRKTTRTEGRKTTLMSYLCQGVGLVHELAQCVCSEECVDNAGNCLCINKVSGTEHLVVTNIHTLANGTAHTSKTNCKLISQLFAYSTYTTIAQMVNIINVCLAVDQFDEILDNLNDILLCQHTDIIVR